MMENMTAMSGAAAEKPAEAMSGAAAGMPAEAMSGAAAEKPAEAMSGAAAGMPAEEIPGAAAGKQANETSCAAANNTEPRDVIIIGGGPAGLAAAVELYKKGITDILILEREKNLGGILRQCIHDGFGLTRFGVTLSGPEYAQRFIDEVERLQIPYLTNATVVELNGDKEVTVATREGLKKYAAKAVILTMGCRERTRGALGIPGERPTGVYTAGVAQAYMNLYNRMPGKEVVILGSGDIGMIMARRLTLEGAHVHAVFEILPTPSGLPRNIQQCLRDYDIPLHLSHTVTQIHGDKRLEGVTISQVDEHLQPIAGTETYYPCDTLILSVGLIPENELSLDAGVTLDQRTKGAYVDEFFQTDVPGVFAAGNVLHVHDLVDFVSMEAEKLADSAARYVREGSLPECRIQVTTDKNIGHTIPQTVSGEVDVNISLRVRSVLSDVKLVVRQGERVLVSKKMKKALPAVMINLAVKGEDMSGTENLVVSVEPVEEKANQSGAEAAQAETSDDSAAKAAQSGEKSGKTENEVKTQEVSAE